MLKGAEISGLGFDYAMKKAVNELEPNYREGIHVFNYSVYDAFSAPSFISTPKNVEDNLDSVDISGGNFLLKF